MSLPDTLTVGSYSGTITLSATGTTSVTIPVALIILSPSSAATTTDPDASPDTVKLLSYLAALPNQSSHRLISGQFDEPDTLPETTFSVTGQYPGLAGKDYYRVGRSLYIGDTQCGFYCYAQAGSLIVVSLSMNNPEGGNWLNTAVANYANIYTENGNASNVNFLGATRPDRRELAGAGGGHQCCCGPSLK